MILWIDFFYNSFEITAFGRPHLELSRKEEFEALVTAGIGFGSTKIYIILTLHITEWNTVLIHGEDYNMGNIALDLP